MKDINLGKRSMEKWYFHKLFKLFTISIEKRKFEKFTDLLCSEANIPNSKRGESWPQVQSHVPGEHPSSLQQVLHAVPGDEGGVRTGEGGGEDDGEGGEGEK